MRKIKAVVLEKSGTRYTVLDQEGTFRQVHRRLDAEVGEEIQIASWTEYFRGVRIWAGAVALFVLVITSVLGWNMIQAPTVVALLSVDINPSLQLEIDNQGCFVAFKTQNEDAKRMLNKINLKGKPMEAVLDEIVSQAYDQKFLSTEQPWVVVGYSPMTNKTLEQMPKALNKHQITSWVTKIGEEKGLTPQIAVFSLTSQERELAQKGDLTLGEYALWQTADKAGVVMQPEKLKDSSERVRLLENPQVQVQIKQEKERQSVSIGKPLEKGTGKILPVGKSASSVKDLFSWIDKSRNSVGDQRENQLKRQDLEKANVKDNTDVNHNTSDKYKDNANANTKAKDEDHQKAKEQENYLKKDLNNTNDREHRETQRTKYDKVYVPQIRNLENLRRNTFRTYNSPEYDGEKQQRR